MRQGLAVIGAAVLCGLVTYGAVKIDMAERAEARDPKLATEEFKRAAVGILLPDRPNFWLVELHGGAKPTVKVLDDYADAGDCWRATFYVGKPQDPFRACLPLDEAAEQALARFIEREAYGSE